MAVYPLLERLKKLISALTSAQKRDFRRYIQSLGGDNTRYVRLFDAIQEWLKLKKFPEKFLSELVTRQAIRRPEEFSAVAGILFEKILESMRGAPKTRLAKSQIRDIISDIQFLIDIELYTESLALLEKAREMVKKFDYAHYLLDLLSIERDILFLSRRSDFFHRLEEIKKEENRIAQRLATDQAIYSLNVEVLKRLVQQEQVSDAASLQLGQWRQLVQADSEHIAGLPFRTQRRLFLALMNDIDFYEQSPNPHPETRIRYAQKIMHLYDRYPQFKAEEPDLYIQHLGTFLSFALEQKAWHFFEQAQADLALLEGTAGFFRWVVPVYLHWYYETEAYPDGCRFIEEQDLIRQIELFHDKMTPSRYMSICFTAFQLHWINNRPADAFQWLNRIITYKPASFQLDLQCFARFLQIPVLCDCGTFEQHLNPLSMIEGLQRWLRKHHFDAALHQNMMSLLQEIVRNPATYYASAAATKALAHLEQQLTVDSTPTHPLTLILVWSKARQEKKSMPQVMASFRRV